MNERVFERMLREGKITALDVLQRTPAQRVDGVLEILLRHLPCDEVRRALYERTCIAPLGDMGTLRIAYYKHFDHAPSIASASKPDAHLGTSLPVA